MQSINKDEFTNFLNAFLNNGDNAEINNQLNIYFQNNDFIDNLFIFFYTINDLNYRKLIINLIKSYIKHINKNIKDINIIKINFKKIVDFVYIVSKNNDICIKLIKMNLENLKYLLSTNSRFIEDNIFNVTIIQLINNFKIDYIYFTSSNKNVYILLNYIRIILLKNNFFRADSIILLEQFIVYLNDILENHIFKTNNIQNQKINLFLNNFKMIYKIYKEIIIRFGIDSKSIVLEFLLNNENFNFYIKLINYFENNLKEENLDIISLYLKLFKKINCLINKNNNQIFNRLKNKKIVNLDNFKTFYKNLFKFIYYNLHFVLNDKDFHIKSIIGNITDSFFYNFFNDSLNFLISFDSNDEFIGDISQDLFLNILMNLLLIVNNNNDLIDGQTDLFIKRHLDLIDDKVFDINHNPNLYENIRYMIIKITEYIDNGYKLVYTTIYQGIKDVFQFDNLKDDKLYESIKNCKWFNSTDEYEKLELYFLLLIIINNQINNELGEFDFINFIFDNISEKLMKDKYISLKLKFINYIILYQTGILKSEQEIYNNKYLTFIFQQINTNNEITVNSYIIKLLFKYIKIKKKDNKAIFKKILSYGSKIADFIWNNFNKEYIDLITYVFVNKYKLFEIEVSHDYIKIFENITDVIINNIKINLNNSEKIDNNKIILIDSLVNLIINLTIHKSYNGLFSNKIWCLINDLITIKNEDISFTTIDLIYTYIKYNIDKNNIYMLLFIIRDVYNYNLEYDKIILIMTEFLLDQNFKIQNDNYEDFKNFTIYCYTNAKLKNNWENFTSYLIVFINRYNNYFNSEFINYIYNSIFNYLDKLNEYANKEFSFYQKIDSYLVSDIEIFNLFIIQILYLNSNTNIDLEMNIMSNINDIYKLIINEFKLNLIDFQYSRIILTCLILTLNKNFLKNENLAILIFQYLIFNLKINYYKLELLDSNHKGSKNILKLQNELENIINGLYCNKYYKDDYFLEFDKKEFLKNEEEKNNTNNFLDKIIYNNNEYDLFKILLQNKSFCNITKEYEYYNDIIFLQNIEVFNCTINDRKEENYLTRVRFIFK